VGIFTVGVLTGLEDEGKLRDNGADAVIPSVKDLIDVIKNRL